MRKVTSLILLAGISMLAWGQTGQVENSPIYYKDGYVGIGTIQPQQLFHIKRGKCSY